MRKYLVLFAGPIGLVVSVVMACSKGGNITATAPSVPEVVAPQLTADSIAAVTINTASFYGTITGSGNAQVSERGVYWGKTANPATNKTPATSYKTNGSFVVDLKDLEPNTTYFVRAFATNSAGTSYAPDKQFTTGTVPQPELFTDTLFATGAYTAFVAGKMLNAKGVNFKEIGICIGKDPGPSVAGTHVKAASANEQNLFLRINDLEPATSYYIRTYATDVYGTTTYGANVKLATIAKGNVSYTLAQNANPSDEEKAAYVRIKKAFDEAVDYYNKYTSITKSLYVTYNTGVATADASISGSIRVGPQQGYQRTGTALHEMAHAVGVGQHSFWTGNLIAGGIYQGIYANKMLRFMTRNPSEALKGDNLHFWPYGINGASEDTGDEMLYITNVLIMQGMKKDGLPSSN
ncbi:fibronectin type III domain-containing protein [Filimonas effusa]|uniref:Fibronectin type III domain-containing protein n=1 Tax=Filimonas effusa TaxID=2508721 RepID=A0A4Q1DA25_9BACT|nr:fibronectin type III domain-containing protein [Filimonas effusa]RXK85748.1 fibronectin type III domain-containing protein [Filimonas effusa]